MRGGSLVAVILRSNPLSSKKSVTLKELAKENLIVLKSHTVLYKLSTEAFRKAGLIPDISFTERRFLSTFDLHESNGIALFFKRDANYVNNPGNIVVDITPEVPISSSLVYLRKHQLSELERDFIEATKVFAKGRADNK